MKVIGLFKNGINELANIINIYKRILNQYKSTPNDKVRIFIKLFIFLFYEIVIKLINQLNKYERNYLSQL
jgi:hypothetical protein